MQRQIVSGLQPLHLDVYVAFFLPKSFKPSMFKGLNVLKDQRIGVRKLLDSNCKPNKFQIRDALLSKAVS